MRYALCLLLTLSALAARAQSHVYIGPKPGCADMGMQTNAWQCTLNWTAGTAPGLSSSVLIGDATVSGVFSSATVLGLVLNGTNLQTLGSLQINDTFVWNGGFIATGGTIDIVGTAAIDGPSQVNLQGTDLRVSGTGILTWTGGSITMDTQAAIDNRGTFDIQGDGLTLSGNTFVNRTGARLTRTMGTGTATLGATVTNEGGQILVDTGTLQLDGATLQGGVYNVASGATLMLSRFGPYTLSGTLVGAAEGRFILDNGAVPIGLAGPASLDVGGSGLEWQDGLLDPGGETLTNEGLLVLTDFHGLDNGTLRNEGTVRWESGTQALTNFTIENAGLFDLQGAGSAFAGSVGALFVNADGGVLRRSEGTGNVNVGIPITNADGGTIALITDALFLSSNASLDLQPGSRLQGTGTLDKGSSNSVTFAGIVAPGASPGVLRWVGDSAFPFDPTSTATLEIELGGPAPGTGFDQVDVVGPAVLGGTLRVTVLGGFEPSEGDRFLIVPATGGATGAFDAIELPDGMTGTVETSAAGAELVIGAPTSIEAGDAVPTALALHGARPNPFQRSTALRVDLPDASSVRVAVYDALGREVAVLLDGAVPAGSHLVRLEAGPLPSGSYVVRMTTESGWARTRRLTILR